MKSIVLDPLTIALCTTALAYCYVDMNKYENKLLLGVIAFRILSVTLFQLFKLNKYITDETYRVLCTTLDPTWPVAFTFIHSPLNHFLKEMDVTQYIYLPQQLIDWVEQKNVLSLSMFSSALTNSVIAPLISKACESLFDNKSIVRAVVDTPVNFIAEIIKLISLNNSKDSLTAFVESFFAGTVNQLIVNKCTQKADSFRDSGENIDRSMLNGVIYAISKVTKSFGENMLTYTNLPIALTTFCSFAIYCFCKRSLEEITSQWHKNIEYQKNNQLINQGI